MPAFARIEATASAFPPNVYTQEDVARLLGVKNPVVLKLLSAPHIQQRHLAFDAAPGSEQMEVESLPQLHRRFMKGIHTFGVQAAQDALTKASVDAKDIKVIVTVTSSGLALPGISAILMKQMGLNTKAHRVDIVGMGCNAGMSGLRTLSQYLSSMPAGTKGLLLCCEVNSAIYIRDETVGTGIVNSLFGDGAVGVVVSATPALPQLENFSLPSLISAGAIAPLDNKSFLNREPRLTLTDFEVHTFLEYYDDMRYEVDGEQALYNFKLSKRIPAAVAIAVKEPVLEMLERNKLAVSDVKHWIVHSGGAAVIEGVMQSLGLPENSLRHTVSVLRDHGNISSGSFLVSMERLIAEHVAAKDGKQILNGDIAVVIAMGPGTTVEAGLGYFA